MSAPKVRDEAEVKRWHDEGRTYQWMADRYASQYGIECGPGMFANLARRRGWQSRQVRYHDLLPWRVAREHLRQYPAVMLRAEGRRRAGQALSAQIGPKLERWLQRLKDDRLVVHYDRAQGGFLYVPKNRKDTDIIRRSKS